MPQTEEEGEVLPPLDTDPLLPPRPATGALTPSIHRIETRHPLTSKCGGGGTGGEEGSSVSRRSNRDHIESYHQITQYQLGISDNRSVTQFGFSQLKYPELYRKKQTYR